MGIGWKAFQARYRGIGIPEGIGSVGGLFVSFIHGVAFRLPAGWSIESVLEANRVRQGVILDIDNFDQNAWAEFIGSNVEHEAFVIAADMRLKQTPAQTQGAEIDLAPGIAVMFEGVANSERPFDLIDHVETDVDLFGSAYTDYRLILDLHPLDVSGCEAVEYVAKFELRHDDLLDRVIMRERAIYILQDPAIYSVRMFDYPELERPLEYDFSRFPDSLVIA